MAYSETNYKKYDGPGKIAVVNHLIEMGYNAVIRKEDKKADLEIQDNHGGPIEYHEVEIKAKWIDAFKYKDVHIPKRKGKLRDRCAKEGRSVFFWVLNEPRTKAWFIWSDSLRDDRMIEKPVRNNDKPEQFFSIPIEECELIELKGGK